MTSQSISRKNFIKNSSILLASSCVMAPSLIQAEETIEKPTGKKFMLKNVRLETGFDYDADEVIHTKTDLFTVEIEDGKILKISP
ncbi:MAG: deaminase, partial [Pedobacter sp.]